MRRPSPSLEGGLLGWVIFPLRKRAASSELPLEAAGRQDHALLRPDQDLLPAVLRAEADDAVLLLNQLVRAHLEHRLDLPIQERLEQVADEGGAVADEALLVALRQELEGEAERLGEDAPVGRLGHRHRGRAEHRALAELVLVSAEIVGVEEARIERAAAGLPALELGVVVGVAGDGLEAERGALFEVADDRRGRVEEALDEPRVAPPVGETEGVRQRLLARVGDADLGHVVVVRDPEHAAGDGGRPADLRRLLHEEDLGACVVGGDRRHEAGPAAPDDQDVGLVRVASLALEEHVSPRALFRRGRSGLRRASRRRRGWSRR